MLVLPTVHNYTHLALRIHTDQFHRTLHTFDLWRAPHQFSVPINYSHVSCTPSVCSATATRNQHSALSQPLIAVYPRHHITMILHDLSHQSTSPLQSHYSVMSSLTHPKCKIQTQFGWYLYKCDTSSERPSAQLQPIQQMWEELACSMQTKQNMPADLFCKTHKLVLILAYGSLWTILLYLNKMSIKKKTTLLSQWQTLTTLAQILSPFLTATRRPIWTKVNIWEIQGLYGPTVQTSMPTCYLHEMAR